MGFLSTFFAGGVGEAAKAIGGAAKDIEDVFSVSDREKLAAFNAETKRLEVEQAGDRGQLEINKVEAAHKSLFVAGWRPFVGWVCAAGMLYHFLLFPLIGPFVEQYAGIELIQLEWSELSVVLMGMLGLGGLRTAEKFKGVHRQSMKE